MNSEIQLACFSMSPFNIFQTIFNELKHKKIGRKFSTKYEKKNLVDVFFSTDNSK